MKEKGSKITVQACSEGFFLVIGKKRVARGRRFRNNWFRFYPLNGSGISARFQIKFEGGVIERELPFEKTDNAKKKMS